MKKYSRIFSALAVLLLTLFVLPTFTNKAEAAEEEYFVYTVDNGNATVIRYTNDGNGGVVEIPATLGGYPVTGIGPAAFTNYERLSVVVIPDTVTAIGSRAFMGCKSLSEIIIPNGVTVIDEFTFFDCGRLQNVSIPTSVTTIEKYAFYNCFSLPAVSIPDSVTVIGESAFSSCANLWHVLYAGTEAQWAGIAIGSDNTNLTDAVKHYNCTDPTILNLQNKQCRICACTHVYDNACDTKCDNCGDVRSVSHTWSGGVCSVCGAIDPDATKPTESPTVPTTAPTEPSTEPTTAPTSPTEPSTEPTTAPTNPTEPSTKPTTEPTKPTEAPITKPTVAPTTEPATKPTQNFPVVQTKPIATSPVELSTQAPTAPTDTEPTESSTEATIATEATDPTQPQEPVPQKQNKGITWVIVSLSIVCLAGGGAAAWFVIKKKK